MRNIVRLAAVICTTAFLTGCATGPKYEAVNSSIPGLDPSNGRIYFYRNVSMLIGGGLQPAVLLNGTKVGSATPGGFFFVDHSPGPIEVATSTEVERKVTFNLEAGQVRYVHMYVGVGLLVGRVYPELVDAKVAEKHIESLSYTGNQLRR